MIQVSVNAIQMVATLQEAVVGFTATPTDTAELGDRIVPRDIRQFLARLRLLEGVPFAYLVPDSALLPPESIRFFYVDRSWTDALVQGALSVGTVNSADRAQLEQLYGPIRDEIDQEERVVRMPGSESVQAGPAGLITGFLLRSRAVSGWPGMHVRAYRRDVIGDDEIVDEAHPDRLKLLRLERLAPAVLLALFDGLPAVVHLEEPRQGIQFGVRLQESGGTNSFQAFVPARDVVSGDTLDPEVPMRVFFRGAAPGVLDLRRTGQEFVNTPGTNMGTSLDGAEFALQMIRFPYRQVFGDPSVTGTQPIRDVFRPSVGKLLRDFELEFAEVIG
ncbi:MAG: hypothetical protein ACREMQ_19425 [Longimicrobiales bacterium]